MREYEWIRETQSSESIWGFLTWLIKQWLNILYWIDIGNQHLSCFIFWITDHRLCVYIWCDSAGVLPEQSDHRIFVTFIAIELGYWVILFLHVTCILLDDSQKGEQDRLAYWAGGLAKAKAMPGRLYIPIWNLPERVVLGACKFVCGLI